MKCGMLLCDGVDFLLLLLLLLLLLTGK